MKASILKEQYKKLEGLRISYESNERKLSELKIENLRHKALQLELLNMMKDCSDIISEHELPF